jgi:hypothetical protein
VTLNVSPSVSWLMITYRVPSEPSALRVATWRALKQLGAVKLGDGHYFLPDIPRCAAAVDELTTRIKSGGGSAMTFKATGLNEADDRGLLEAFLEARADEFMQVVKSASRLIEHVAREEAGDDYRFAEVDALEEELEKVRRQFQRAVDRDYLNSDARDRAASAVSDATQRLGNYVDDAFRRENGLPARVQAVVSGRSTNSHSEHARDNQ